MSVAGIDLGNDTSCVALARKRGIDVILNKESKRETPAVASFGTKQRFLGSDGLGAMATNMKNTIYQVRASAHDLFAFPLNVHSLHGAEFAHAFFSPPSPPSTLHSSSASLVRSSAALRSSMI